MTSEILVKIVSGNGLVSSGNKRLPTPIWPTSMSPYCVTRPQWVNSFIVLIFLQFLQRDYEQQKMEKARDGSLKAVNGNAEAAPQKKKRRWDQTAEDTPASKKKASGTSWETAEASTPSNSRWDETPGRPKGGETPGATPGASTRMWDATPGHATPGAATPGRETPGHETPGARATPSARKNRWDETPRTERGEERYNMAPWRGFNNKTIQMLYIFGVKILQIHISKYEDLFRYRYWYFQYKDKRASQHLIFTLTIKIPILAVYPKNFYGSSDICPIGFIYSIQICEMSHQTFGPSHRKCPTCPKIFVNTVLVRWHLYIQVAPGVHLKFLNHLINSFEVMWLKYWEYFSIAFSCSI